MLDVVNGFEKFVTRASSSEGKSLRYRANLLWVHALAAMTMAPLFSATGKEGMLSPNFEILRQFPGAPVSIAVFLGAGGLVLGLGCVLNVRRMEITGLIALMGFYLLLAISFLASGIRYFLLDLSGPKPAIYAPVVYLHLSIIMAVHMSTLVRNRFRMERQVS
jgi:hypothetical protein